MRRTDFLIAILAMTLMAGCQDRDQTASVPTPTVRSSPSATTTAALAATDYRTDKWIGRWQGVEGTYLDLFKKGDKYIVTIADLDGPKIYEGVAAGDHIEFQRNSKTESIRATDGKGTGMKWLATEKNCLVVKVGSEGFCRK